MSSYTTELRNICQYLAKNVENEESEAVITASAPLIFDFWYPFYDEGKRVKFQQDFVRHFYMREIGQETYGLWKHALRDWLIVEMPYYNKLFENASIDYDPLDDVDYTRTTQTSGSSHVNTNGSGDATNNTTGSGTTKYIDTPQDNVNSIAGGYLTAVQENSNTGNETTHNESSGQSIGTSSGSGSETVRGKMGSRSYAEMIMQQRETFINVEKQIFEAMNVLFMQIY